MAGNPDIAKYGWKPGQSGNPGGRPKGIAAKAREHTDTAIQVLVEGLGDENRRIRIDAAKELLDRGWGKPLTMTADVTSKLDDLSDESIDAAISVLRAAVGSAGEAGERADGETTH